MKQHSVVNLSQGADAGRRALHYPSLDGLRGAAALLVVIFHASAVLRAGPTTDRMIQLLTLIVSGFGDIAVAMFFALSGFLLFSEFSDHLVLGTKRNSLRKYFSRRFLRIYPGYWVALIAAEFLLGPLVGSRLGLFTLAGRYTDSSHVFIGISVAWTLAVEVAFYAFLPIFASALGMFVRRLAKREYRTAAVALSCVLLLGVPRLYQHFVTDRYIYDLRLQTSLFQYIDWFALGMLLSLVVTFLSRRESTGGRYWRLLVSRPVMWTAAFALYLISIQIIGYDGSEVSIVVPVADLQLTHMLFGLSAFLVLVPLTIGPLALSKNGFFATRGMCELGLISYGVYLWHDIFLKRYLREVDFSAGVPQFLFVLAWLIPLSLFSGWLSRRFVEKPAMRLSW